MLQDRYAYDKWGSRLSYVVIKELAKATATLSSYTTSRTDGVILVADYEGNQVTESDSNVINAYIVISHGKDKKGGYLSSATQTAACGSTAKDSENCDGDATFIDSELNESETAANFYDDLVHWRTLTSIVGTQAREDNSIVQVSSDYQIACLTRNDGRAYCIGNNTSGQLGDGTTSPRTVYTLVAGNYTDWKQVDADNDLTCGIRGADAIYCWGRNTYGQVGDNTTTGPRLVPTVVVPASGANSGWTALTVDYEHACGIRAGHLLCWGRDTAGQLGDDTVKASKDQPTEVAGGYSDWVDMALGTHHSCGIRNEAGLYKAYCWGRNAEGQLGDNSVTERLSPTEVYGGYTNWTRLESNHTHTCGLRSNGVLWCWGENDYGQIGIDNFVMPQTTPVQVKDTAGTGTWYDWTDVSVMADSTCGIRAGGRLFCWGRDNFGQLGNGATTVTKDTPQEVTGSFTDWTAAVVGNTVCGLRAGNNPYCWGQNNVGQVGDGTTVDPVTVPVAVTAY